MKIIYMFPTIQILSEEAFNAIPETAVAKDSESTGWYLSFDDTDLKE